MEPRSVVYGNPEFVHISVVVNKLPPPEKLEATPLVSAVLQKGKRLGLHSPELLESLAVARGCWHYRTPDRVPAPDVSTADFSNEELAVALLSPCLPYSPHTIRVGAAMVGATGNDPGVLTRLATAEGCVAEIRYIAEAALGFEPANLFWQQLLGQLPGTRRVRDGVMPHPTRFVSMTGITRLGRRPAAIWIRPRPDLALTHG